jgi:hypothetical protein
VPQHAGIDRVLLMSQARNAPIATRVPDPQCVHVLEPLTRPGSPTPTFRRPAAGDHALERPAARIAHREVVAKW